MHRPSPPAAKPRGGEGLAKPALDCFRWPDFTEVIRSNLFIAFVVAYACNSEVLSSFRVSLHAGVYTWVVLVVQDTYARRYMYTWVATVVRKGDFKRKTISCKVC